MGLSYETVIPLPLVETSSVPSCGIGESFEWLHDSTEALLLETIFSSSLTAMKPTIVTTVCSLAITFILIYNLITYLWAAYRKGLRTVPGPLLARFSGLYRLSMVSSGGAPFEYRRVHEKYGPVVRVGPNHVSFSDASVIPQIYGIGSEYLKVIYGNLPTQCGC